MQDTTHAIDTLRTVYDEAHSQATYPYPFGGYEALLEEMYVRAGNPTGPTRVLDLNLGHGNLAAHFHEAGCHVTGVRPVNDKSAEVEKRLPRLTIAQRSGDVHAWLEERGEDAARYGIALWSYDLRALQGVDAIVRLVDGVFSRALVRQKRGVMLLGGVSFLREKDRVRYEPSDTHTWRAPVFEGGLREALVERRYKVSYAQLFPCAGIVKIKQR